MFSIMRPYLTENIKFTSGNVSYCDKRYVVKTFNYIIYNFSFFQENTDVSNKRITQFHIIQIQR